MMIQYFTNEGENAFSIQAPRVQKFKKKTALGKLLKIIFLRISYGNAFRYDLNHY
jgi:hypothetical protein